MRLKAIVDEDFQDYKKTAMFLATCRCDFKCCEEGGFDISVCQNSPMASQPTIDIPDEEIVARYKANPLSKAIVFGGLEPFLQMGEMYDLIYLFRESGVTDDIVIYTGYRLDELLLSFRAELHALARFKGNIILKTGRFNPNGTPHFDKTLGVMLANEEQFAVLASDILRLVEGDC